MADKTIKIGGATGFWGETDMAIAQFLREGDLDYIVFDYLAEITMSIMARARASDPKLGYATDFVSAIVKPNLKHLASSGIKLISNAGGVNPEACGDALRAVISEAGLDLKVVVIAGDDLLNDLDRLEAMNASEMFSGEAFPPKEKIASANAYIGAFPIAAALAAGADIVVTGRCVDSAVTLGACIHEFGWSAGDLDKLAAGSAVGHLIECGPQATGGNFTDWEQVADSLHEVGYPIAEVWEDGTADIYKPADTGGLVNRGTVAEQLLYEIGDPAAYMLPDVICDFTQIQLEQVATGRVRMTHARGRGVPETYKTSMTWADGWRAGSTFWYVGRRAADKARIFADEAVKRTRRKLQAMGAADFDEVAVDIFGEENFWGSHAAVSDTREVALKVACKHQDARAVGLLLREMTGCALGAPAGMAFFAGARAKPSPVIRLFSVLVDKSALSIKLIGSEDETDFAPPATSKEVLPAEVGPIPEAVSAENLIEVPLETLAWGRSGDKGDKANIGIIARKAEYLPWIAKVLTTDYVADRFAHFMTAPAIDRFYMPGLPALNFLLHNALGGGGIASLRNDPQAKAYAQVLLDTPIAIPQHLLEA
ncbi:Protein of unknown function (DUF1446) [gamma proteobacterium HIMB55]|nr:Protein of unknown function (DUF1446) [gamma proteobacterium HIMB55]